MITILKQGIDKNIQTKKDGVTCLMAAAGNGHRDIVEKLLAMSADTQLVDSQGNTALDYAKYYKHDAIVEMITVHVDNQHIASFSEQDRQQIFLEIAKIQHNGEGDIAFVLSTYNLNDRQAQMIQQEGEEKNWIAALPTPIPLLPHYELLDDRSYETSGKAQVEYHFQVGEEHLSKETLSLLLQQLYQEATQKTGWKHHDAPTVIVIYLYTSKAHFESESVSHIGAVSKTPSQEHPQYEFHVGHIESIGKPLEEKWGISGEERKHIYGLLGQAEDRALQEANKAFPDFGEKHTDTFETLMAKYHEEIRQQYGLTEEQASELFAEGFKKNWPSLPWKRQE